MFKFQVYYKYTPIYSLQCSSIFDSKCLSKPEMNIIYRSDHFTTKALETTTFIFNKLPFTKLDNEAFVVPTCLDLPS